jgi:MerR family transcriptional regulator, thiopeptide resistance regulator
MPDAPATIGRLARRFGLSRSTLLYYDRIGLLRPSARTDANYRRYAPEDAARLAQVCRFREAGVPLADIRRILEARGDGLAAVLERRLAALNGEIAALRRQQDVIVRLLRRPSLRRRTRTLDKAQWVALLRAAGLDDAGMNAWHREFERSAPEAHQDFLESLGIPEADVRRIRAASRRDGGR